jgi:CheY-like chemotaxis protein
MEWSSPLVILGILGLIAIFFLGGRVVVKPGGVEINTDGLLKYLREAEKDKNVPTSNPPKISPDQLKGRLPLGRILWIDDHPLGNQRERLALASIGIFSDAYTHNEDGLEALKRENYDVIVSDIGRDAANETGWDLLAAINNARKEIPFIFYTFGTTREIVLKAKQLGAYSVEQAPNELIDSILKNLRPHVSRS